MKEKNLRATIEAQIANIEDFDFPCNLAAVDTEYGSPVILCGIKDGLLVGNEDWEGQTGDACQLAPANVDLDTLIYISKLLRPQEGRAYTPDPTDPKDDLIAQVVFLFQQDVELGDYTAIAELLSNLSTDQLKNYLPE